MKPCGHFRVCLFVKLLVALLISFFSFKLEKFVFSSRTAHTLVGALADTDEIAGIFKETFS